MKVLRILKIAGIVLFSLLLILIGIIYFKKDSLIQAALKSFAEPMQMDVHYHSSSLSLFSTFPNVGISLDSLSIEEKQGRTPPLVQMDRLTLGLDIWSVFSRDAYVVKEIILRRPHVQLVCYSDTTCNYDLLMQDESGADTTARSGVQVRIEDFQIQNGHFQFIDSVGYNHLEIQDWIFQMNGSYNENILNANYDQKNMLLTYSSEGISLADSIQLTGKGGLGYDMDLSQFTFNDNDLQLNELKFELNGMFKLLADRYDLDFEFHLPSNEFKPLLSLIPAFYTRDFQELEVEGQFSLNGVIKGPLDYENDIYPAMDMQSSIREGSIHYPELPGSLENIHMEARVQKDSGSLDLLKVMIPDYHLSLSDGSTFRGNLNLSNPVKDAQLEGALTANVDLSSIRDIYPMPDVKELKGKLNAQLDFNFQMSDLSNNNYDKMELSGQTEVSSLRYKADGLMAYELGSLKAQLKSRALDITATGFNAGSSNISSIQMVTGPIGNYFNEQNDFDLNITARSERINVNEFLEPASKESEAGSMTGNYDLSGYKVVYDLMINELIYDHYEIKDIEAQGSFKEGVLGIQKSSFNYHNSDFNVQGQVSKIEAYLNENAPLQADLSVSGGRFDLLSYMNQEPAVASDATVEESYFYLSPDLSLIVDYALAGIDYGEIQFDNVQGRLNMQDGNVTIVANEMQGMGGAFSMEGSLKTKEGQAPVFDFNSAVQSVAFSRVFQSFVSVQKIAPLMGRLNGVFDARIATSGSLDKELYPNYSDLDAQGFIETKKAEIKGYEPLSLLDQKLGTRLSVDFPIDDTKKWFLIDDGSVIIEPFTIAVWDNDLTIEGKHSIEGEMNYQFTGPIPVDQLEKSPEGAQIVQKARQIFNELPLRSEYQLKDIDIQVLLTGTRNNPKVNLRLANDFREELKKRIASQLREEKEEVREEVEKTIEETKEDVKKAAKDKVTEIITGEKDTAGTNSVDSLKKKAEDKLEDAKEKLNKWNPFKNKKG